MKKNIFVIIGSASNHSANRQLAEYIEDSLKDEFTLTLFNDLKTLPHFDPELSVGDEPESIRAFRRNIEQADGILICTPEYVFSIPSGLKNAIEWCVSTNVFSGKPTGLITASAQGEKGHEELQLIMKTVMASFTNETILHIQGIKGKINEQGEITDHKTEEALAAFVKAFRSICR